MADYSGYGMPSVDFSSLGNLTKTYNDARLGAARERTLAEIGKGTFDPAKASQAVMAVDPELGISLARLAEARSNRGTDEARRREEFEFRKQEAGRAQGNADRSYSLQVRQADEAARGFDYKEVDDGNGGKTLVRIQKATGEITRPAIGGQPAEPGNPFSNGPMKEHEGKSALFADRAATSHETINKFENINNQPGGTIGAVVEGAAGGKFPKATNAVVSGERGQLMDAKRAFVNALLRRESGAAINPSEFQSYDIEYFPQIGNTPQQIEAKRLHRSEVIAGLAREAGKTYRPKFTLDQKTGAISRTDSGQQASPSGREPQFKSPDEVTRMVQTGRLKSGDTFRDPDGILRRVP